MKNFLKKSSLFLALVVVASAISPAVPEVQDPLTKTSAQIQKEFAAAEMRAAKITAVKWMAAAAVAVFVFKKRWPQRAVQAARRPVAVALTAAAGLLTSLAQKVAAEHSS